MIDQFDLSLATAERIHILKILARCKGNKAWTARCLRIAKETLAIRLKNYGVTANANTKTS